MHTNEFWHKRVYMRYKYLLTSATQNTYREFVCIAYAPSEYLHCVQPLDI